VTPGGRSAAVRRGGDPGLPATATLVERWVPVLVVTSAVVTRRLPVGIRYHTSYGHGIRQRPEWLSDRETRRLSSPSSSSARVLGTPKIPPRGQRFLVRHRHAQSRPVPQIVRARRVLREANDSSASRAGHQAVRFMALLLGCSSLSHTSLHAGQRTPSRAEIATEDWGDG